MKRKRNESTRTFFKDLQIGKIKRTRLNLAEEQKERIRNEISKKSKLYQVAEQNLNLAQSKVNHMRILKVQGKYLSNCLLTHQ